MPILNYTTSVDSTKTIAEVTRILVDHGAHKITTDYKGSLPIALTFCLTRQGKVIGFSLPCNYTGVLKAMERSRKVPRRLCTDEQALRVSWRILKDWIQAQMAIVEAQLAEVTEVFLPYAITPSGSTLYKQVTASGDNTLLLLEQ